MRRLGTPRQRGTAAVEFALVLPLLLLILLGMVDLGMYVNAQAVTANAARDGARAASLGSTEAQTRTLALKTVALTGAAPTVTVECYQTISSTVPDCTGTSYDTQRQVNYIVKVTVSYSYTWITPLPTMVGLPSPTTVTKSSYMRIETTS